MSRCLNVCLGCRARDGAAWGGVGCISHNSVKMKGLIWFHDNGGKCKTTATICIGLDPNLRPRAHESSTVPPRPTLHCWWTTSRQSNVVALRQLFVVCGPPSGVLHVPTTYPMLYNIICRFIYNFLTLQMSKRLGGLMKGFTPKSASRLTALCGSAQVSR